MNVKHNESQQQQQRRRTLDYVKEKNDKVVSLRALSVGSWKKKNLHVDAASFEDELSVELRSSTTSETAWSSSSSFSSAASQYSSFFASKKIHDDKMKTTALCDKQSLIGHNEHEHVIEQLLSCDDEEDSAGPEIDQQLSQQLDEEFFDCHTATEILEESDFQANFAERTAKEMSQVMEWWSSNPQISPSSNKQHCHMPENTLIEGEEESVDNTYRSNGATDDDDDDDGWVSCSNDEDLQQQSIQILSEASEGSATRRRKKCSSFKVDDIKANHSSRGNKDDLLLGKILPSSSSGGAVSSCDTGGKITASPASKNDSYKIIDSSLEQDDNRETTNVLLPESIELDRASSFSPLPLAASGSMDDNSECSAKSLEVSRQISELSASYRPSRRIGGRAKRKGITTTGLIPITGSSPLSTDMIELHNSSPLTDFSELSNSSRRISKGYNNGFKRMPVSSKPATPLNDSSEASLSSVDTYFSARQQYDEVTRLCQITEKMAFQIATLKEEEDEDNEEDDDREEDTSPVTGSPLLTDTIELNSSALNDCSELTFSSGQFSNRHRLYNRVNREPFMSATNNGAALTDLSEGSSGSSFDTHSAATEQYDEVTRICLQTQNMANQIATLQEEDEEDYVDDSEGDGSGGDKDCSSVSERDTRELMSEFGWYEHLEFFRWRVCKQLEIRLWSLVLHRLSPDAVLIIGKIQQNERLYKVCKIAVKILFVSAVVVALHYSVLHQRGQCMNFGFFKSFQAANSPVDHPLMENSIVHDSPVNYALQDNNRDNNIVSVEKSSSIHKLPQRHSQRYNKNDVNADKIHKPVHDRNILKKFQNNLNNVIKRTDNNRDIKTVHNNKNIKKVAHDDNENVHVDNISEEVHQKQKGNQKKQKHNKKKKNFLLDDDLFLL